MDLVHAVRRVRDGWGLVASDVRPLAGGTTSTTFALAADGARWVLKVVPDREAPSFVAGLRAARHLEAAGLETGGARLRSSGELVHADGGTAAALLRWVDGRPLEATAADARTIGGALARAHDLLPVGAVPGPPRFDRLDVAAGHLGVEPWVRLAVTEAVAAMAAATSDAADWSCLHGDPAPEAFLASENGVAVIDWGSAVLGPCGYDVASAAMYLGRRQDEALLAGYGSVRPAEREHVEAHLDVLVRFRWAVQADWFARRVVEDDRTGGTDDQANAVGLVDARRHLT